MAAIAGLVLAIVTVAVVVLGAVLFNLISDLTGGIRMTVIDEDLIVAPARRPEADPARRPEPSGPRPGVRPAGEVGTAGRGDVGPSPPPSGDPPVSGGQGLRFPSGWARAVGVLLGSRSLRGYSSVG